MAVNGGITIAYSGVHQAYQLALAAHELGELDTFSCSIYDAPGRWGRLLARMVGSDALASRRIAGLPLEKVTEHPWPLLWHEVRKRLEPASANNWLETNGRFDRWVAGRLRNSTSRIFVGAETCAAESFRVGHERGMKLVYDCPGFNPEVSGQLALRAAEEWNLPRPAPADSPEIKAVKDRELALADVVLVYSEAHQQSLEQRGVEPRKFVLIPLGADLAMWFPRPAKRPPNGPLRVLFAGRGTLLKGLPYLLEAVKKCGSLAQLDCVGKIQKELQPLVAPLPNVHVSDPVPRARLRDHYWNHDVLVLPSLGDSFGFVALEAMACGLPVVVTENCGVPVPDPAWRVPVMDGNAIARRLEFYAGNRDALERDGQAAVEFAKQFTPERYREQIKNLFQQLLPHDH